MLNPLHLQEGFLYVAGCKPVPAYLSRRKRYRDHVLTRKPTLLASTFTIASDASTWSELKHLGNLNKQAMRTKHPEDMVQLNGLTSTEESLQHITRTELYTVRTPRLLGYPPANFPCSWRCISIWQGSPKDHLDSCRSPSLISPSKWFLSCL